MDISMTKWYHTSEFNAFSENKNGSSYQGLCWISIILLIINNESCFNHPCMINSHLCTLTLFNKSFSFIIRKFSLGSYANVLCFHVIAFVSIAIRGWHESVSYVLKHWHWLTHIFTESSSYQGKFEPRKSKFSLN